MIAATAPLPPLSNLVPDLKPADFIESNYYYRKGHDSQQQESEQNHKNQQHPNTATSDPIQSRWCDANNFEIANRAFYATINKFTRQACPDPSKRRSSPYSFLENWHMHSIYSKSQQTLLGITPVRPSVILSGDDFMFTPPFIQQYGEFDTMDQEEYDDVDEEEEEEEEYMFDDDEFDDDYDDDDDDDHYWTTTTKNFYTLSPCSETMQPSYPIEHTNSYDDSRHNNITSTATALSPSLFETQNTKYEELMHIPVPDYIELQHELVELKNQQQSAPFNGMLSIEIPIPQQTDHQQHDTDDAVSIDIDSLSPAAETPELSPSSLPEDPNTLSRSSSISSLETDSGKDPLERQIAFDCNSNCSDQQQHHNIYLLPSSSSSSSIINLTNLYDTTTTATLTPTAALTQQTSPASPVTRSPFSSQKLFLDDTCSPTSYQSFADIMNQTNGGTHNKEVTIPSPMPETISSATMSYGSITNFISSPTSAAAAADDEDISASSDKSSSVSSAPVEAPATVPFRSSTYPSFSMKHTDEELGKVTQEACASKKRENASPRKNKSLFSCFQYLYKKLSGIVKSGFNKLFAFSPLSSERQPLL